MATTLKEKTAKGLLWGGFSNGLQQILGLVFGIILARCLSQADYGMIGMLSIFSAVAACMQEGGFIAALNRKKEVSQKDYNAVFWTSIFTSIFFYMVFFLAAPLIADFYHEPRLTSLARYSFLSFLFVSFSIAPRAYIFRNMMVRQSSIISLVSMALSGIVGIIMAYNGYAYWGLATQNITYTLSVSILNYWFSNWRPTLNIDLRPIREIIGFSSRLIVTNIITAANTNYLSVILGRYYTADEVGDFTQANKWNTMGHSIITNMLYSVAQPLFTKTQDNPARQKHVFRKLLRFTAFVSFPVMLCLSLVSEEFIVILITEKWLSSAHILRDLCYAGALMPISFLFSNLLISKGRSTAYMWSSISLCVVQLLIVGICTPYGIGYMVKAYVIVNILWVIVWFLLSRNELGISVTEVLRDIAPYGVFSIVVTIVAWWVTRSFFNLYISFISKVLIVFIAYCASLWGLKSTIFKEILLFLTKRKLNEE